MAIACDKNIEQRMSANDNSDEMLVNAFTVVLSKYHCKIKIPDEKCSPVKRLITIYVYV